jgi:hypothetical protein
MRPDPTERPDWSRLTLLDGHLLVAASALGLGLASYFLRGVGPYRSVHPQIVWAISGLLWAGMIAAPLILVGQRLRGRRAALSLGEWFWLAPSTLFLLMLACACLVGPTFGLILVLVLLGVGLQWALSLAALYRLVAVVFGRAPVVACRWTDRLGCAVCAAVGPALFAELSAALSQL